MNGIQPLWLMSLMARKHANNDLEFISTTEWIFDLKTINNKRASSKESTITEAYVKTKPEISVGNFCMAFQKRESQMHQTLASVVFLTIISPNMCNYQQQDFCQDLTAPSFI